MSDNVRLTHTAHGAVIAVNVGAFQLKKTFATMGAAAKEASRLYLITPQQLRLLEDPTMALPLGLTNRADRIDGDRLFGCGFTVG